MNLTWRPPLNYHSSHVHWKLDMVLGWVEAICHSHRSIHSSWTKLSPTPTHAVSAYRHAFQLALKQSCPVMLVHTHLTGWEILRRLMFEDLHPNPNYFAGEGLLESDFKHITELGLKLNHSQFYLWEPMELNAEEIQEWLVPYCRKYGIQTLVIDDPSMFTGMEGNRPWVSLSKQVNAEVKLFRPIH